MEMLDEPKEKRALSWRQALDAGFVAEDYPLEPLPDGKWVGTLDWKVWGKSSSCLACFFTADDGLRFRLTAFRARRGPGSGRWYVAQDGLLDLSDRSIKTGQRFELHTGANGKGNPAWISAKQL